MDRWHVHAPQVRVVPIGSPCKFDTGYQQITIMIIMIIYNSQFTLAQSCTVNEWVIIAHNTYCYNTPRHTAVTRLAWHCDLHWHLSRWFCSRFSGRTDLDVRADQDVRWISRTGMECGQLVATDRVPIAIQTTAGTYLNVIYTLQLKTITFVTAPLQHKP